MLKINLEGKIAVVSGGGRGIGGATALTLAEAGATVIIGDIILENAEQIAMQIRKKGGKALAVKCSVSDETEVDDMVDAAVDQFGGLDIMVNCAGINRSAPFVLTSAQDLQDLFDVNVKGVYFGCKAALRHMLPQKDGKIVNVASMASKLGFEFSSIYATTKFGVLGMTQSIARDVAECNINVNAVCPGIIRTAMWEKMLDEGAAVLKLGREDIWNKYVEDIPLKRPQEEEDIAACIAFLCSDLAKNITGQGININGGQLCY